jgi:predicted CXXCH cytochrome family protein
MKHVNNRSRTVAWLGAAALLLGLALASGLAAKNGPSSKSDNKPASAPAEYVGAETCKTCHEEIYKQFETTPHYKTLLDTRGGPAHQGCEGCHGPGAEHVNGGGDKTKIFTFKGVSASAISNRCLTCHGQDQERFNFRRSAHHDANVACTECHSPHHPKGEGGQYLMRAPQPLLCFGCHQELGTFMPKMLRSSAAQDQVCFKCHTDKQGPFAFEHVPVKTEGCTICHFPHGSNNPHMLKRAQVNQLCLECHTVWERAGKELAPGPIGPGHNQAIRYQACTLCHTQIHGSNTSEVFFK